MIEKRIVPRDGNAPAYTIEIYHPIIDSIGALYIVPDNGKKREYIPYTSGWAASIIAARMIKTGQYREVAIVDANNRDALYKYILREE